MITKERLEKDKEIERLIEEENKIAELVQEQERKFTRKQVCEKIKRTIDLCLDKIEIVNGGAVEYKTIFNQKKFDVIIDKIEQGECEDDCR